MRSVPGAGAISLDGGDGVRDTAGVAAEVSERTQALADTTALAPDAWGGLRVALSPYLFRGMLVGMAAVAIGLHRLTGSRELAWRFAKGRARDLADLLGVQVVVRGREHTEGLGPVVFVPNHQSHLDILVLLGHLPGVTRFAA